MNHLKPFSINALITFLSCFLILAPLPKQAHAASMRTVAVVNVVNGKINKDLTRVQSKVVEALEKSGQVQLISQDKIEEYLVSSQTSELQKEKLTEKTDGDILYDRVEEFFMAYKNEEALSTADQSIALLKHEPGIRGSLLKNYLLKSQILSEIGKGQEAQASLAEAAALSLDYVEVDDYMFSPTLRASLDATRKRFVAQNKTAALVVNVKGNKSSPIYVNGIYRGNGPRLTMKVPADTLQMVVVGYAPKAAVTLTRGGEITLADKGVSTTTLKKNAASGFADINFYEVQTEVVALGRSLGANQVLTLATKNTGNTSRTDFFLFDVARNTVVNSSKQEVTELAQNTDRLATLASNLIVAPSTQPAPTYVAETSAASTKTEKSISKSGGKSKTILYIVIGAVAVGTGATLALTSGGGSSTTGVTTASVTGPGVGTP